MNIKIVKGDGEILLSELCEEVLSELRGERRG